jgi:hypothetical protein
VTPLFERIFSRFAHRTAHTRAVQNRLPLSSIKESLQTLLDDCQTARAERMAYHIQSARTPTDLWDLRCEMHQCIAHAHNQTEASKRINSLVTVFTGWVAPHQLTRI